MSAVAIVLPVKDMQRVKLMAARLADTLEVVVKGGDKKSQRKISYLLQSNFASAITSCLTHYRV